MPPAPAAGGSGRPAGRPKGPEPRTNPAEYHDFCRRWNKYLPQAQIKNYQALITAWDDRLGKDGQGLRLIDKILAHNYYSGRKIVNGEPFVPNLSYFLGEEHGSLRWDKMLHNKLGFDDDRRPPLKERISQARQQGMTHVQSLPFSHDIDTMEAERALEVAADLDQEEADKQHGSRDRALARLFDPSTAIAERGSAYSALTPTWNPSLNPQAVLPAVAKASASEQYPLVLREAEQCFNGWVRAGHKATVVLVLKEYIHQGYIPWLIDSLSLRDECGLTGPVEAPASNTQRKTTGDIEEVLNGL